MKRGLLVILLVLSMLAIGLPARASAPAVPARYVLMQRLIRAAAGIDRHADDGSQGQPAGRATRQIGELNLPGGLNADISASTTWGHRVGFTSSHGRSGRLVGKSAPSRSPQCRSPK